MKKAKIKLNDVTYEYRTREKGLFLIEKNYDVDAHPEEVKMAKWLFNNVGGNIILLAETDSIYLGKRADYLWNDRLWELKTTHAVKSIDSIVRKALKQIRDNPGGIVIKIEGSKESTERFVSAVAERLRKSCRFSLDVMLVRGNNIEKVIRFKK